MELLNIRALARLLMILFVVANSVLAELVVFPKPDDPEVPASPRYQVAVEGQSVFCYDTYRHGRPTVDQQRLYNRLVNPVAFAIFDFTGSVEVSVEVEPELIEDAANVVVRPLAAGVVPDIKGNTVHFSLPRPGNYIFDPRGDGDRVLCLFTSLPEQDVPDALDPEVRFFGPGVHRPGEIKLNAGETLYLAGGAVLLGEPHSLRAGKHKVLHLNGIDYVSHEGMVRIQQANGVTVRGRGILSGHLCFAARKRSFGIFTEESEDVSFEGITIIDTSGSPLPIRHCRDIRIDSIRIIGHFANSGGIQLNGVTNATARNCFMIAADDGCDLKSSNANGPTQDILFENNLLWTNGGVPMGIILETVHPMDNVVFRRNTVAHYTTYRDYSADGSSPRKGLICFNPGAGGPVNDVRFEDIVIEQSVSERPLIFLGNSKLATRGRYKFQDLPYSTIRNVTFRNIKALHVKNKAVIFDAHNPGDFKAIRFENVTANGQPLSLDQVNIRGAQVEGLIVDP